MKIVGFLGLSSLPRNGVSPSMVFFLLSECPKILVLFLYFSLIWFCLNSLRKKYSPNLNKNSNKYTLDKMKYSIEKNVEMIIPYGFQVKYREPI